MVAMTLEPDNLVSIFIIHEAKAAGRLSALVIKLLILLPRHLLGFLELIRESVHLAITGPPLPFLLD